MGKILNLDDEMHPSKWLAAKVSESPYTLILKSPAGGQMEITESERLLLAAAPDLLELAELVERSTANTFTVHASLIEIINEKARATIAKAKGQ